MFKLIISVVACIYVATVLGEVEGLECYHCYDSFNKALSLRSSENDVFGDRFVRCDKNKNNWNTWICPREYPICVVMSGSVKDHTEVLRSCGTIDFCKTYKPPKGVTLETCRECNTTLCNDDLELPSPSPTSTSSSPSPTSTSSSPSPTSTSSSPSPSPSPSPTPSPSPSPTPSPSPPVNPKALLKFNININLNVKKHPRIDNEYLK